MAKKVGIVVLGDEVLKAEIQESNIAYLLPLLNEWGAEVAFCAILPDDVPTVVRHLRSFLAEADLLILTGGIGPTPDDITREAVATVAGVPLVVHPEAKAILETYYGDRMNANRMVMAQVPEGAVLIPNPVSAAPGFLVARMAVFPGIPRLLHEMFGWIRPHVEGRRGGRVTLYSRAPESAYAGIMRETIAASPGVTIGSYPMMEGEYRVRIAFRAESFPRASAAADFFTDRMTAAGMEISRRIEERGADEEA
ncbi:MAG TPA: molybdopterin-binding protein [Candidatus Deferrimicrobiaceae bacterium]|nr:molybdopterin-binding protein [Candidatus Deferrimicrobiaceae bacterium]